jgi:hypothetical protein
MTTDYSATKYPQPYTDRNPNATLCPAVRRLDSLPIARGFAIAYNGRFRLFQEWNSQVTLPLLVVALK